MTLAAPSSAADVEVQQIFYPKPDQAIGKKTLSEDEALYDLFLRQISEANSSGNRDVESEDGEAASAAKGERQLGTKRLVERPIRIQPNCPIEFVYKRRVVLGNFVSRRETGSGLNVRLTTGEVAAIDVSQVISCWDLLADETLPQTPADWAQVAADALTILGNLSPRKSDLQEFWSLISQRSNALSVDSQDLGIYIFQERRFRSWINPYASAPEAAVWALSAAQRYAAALLLFHDDFHFRRRPSQLLTLQQVEEIEAADALLELRRGAGALVSSGSEQGVGSKSGAGYDLEDLLTEDASRRFRNSAAGAAEPHSQQHEEEENREDEEEGESEGGEGEGSAFVVEGAYRCLDENTALFRECEVFFKYYQERLGVASASPSSSSSEAPFRAGCITRQLRALEMYSMQPAGLSPPQQVKAVLKRLTKPASPDGARMALKEMNLEARGQGPRVQAQGQAQTEAQTPGQQRGKAGATSSPSTPSVLDSLPTSRGGAVSSSTPWPVEVLAAAEQLSQEVAAKREVLAETFMGKPGKRGLSGRMDYRGSNQEHPVICIDGSKAVFLDDAFSLSPQTGEILVHVVDVAGALRRFDVLQQTAKERISSTFLPSGPIHMLPPLALDALKLSTSTPNEVMTVALSVDADEGWLTGIRVFPSVVGPVFPVDIDTADEILDSVNSGDKDGWSFRLGYPESVVKDLVTAQRLVERIIDKQPWVDKHFSAGQQRTFSLNKRTGTYKQAFVDKTPGNRMLNALLTLYSNSTVRFCTDRGVSVPLSWESRDRTDSHLIRRFATQPLRNWLAQLQQKQLRAALKMELPLTRKDCAMAVAHHNSRRKQMSSMQNAGRDIMSFESLESHCAAVLASGQPHVVLNAEGIGRGGTVKLVDFKVVGTVSSNVQRGDKVRVRVRKVVADTRTVILDLEEEEE